MSSFHLMAMGLCSLEFLGNKCNLQRKNKQTLFHDCSNTYVIIQRSCSLQAQIWVQNHQEGDEIAENEFIHNIGDIQRAMGNKTHVVKAQKYN